MTRARSPWPVPRLAPVAILALALAGCGGPDGPSAPAGTTAGRVRDQAAPVWRAAAQCIRDHGYPGFPDPIVADDGTATLPAGVGETLDRQHRDAERACEPILQRLPASVRERMGQGGGDAAATSELIAERKRFAECMRRSGEPGWPDPDANGRFTLPTTPGFGKGPGSAAALETCRRVLRDPRGDLGVR